MLKVLKRSLPADPVAVRIVRGPFRGARVMMPPRHSLRRIFGVYEHELQPWLQTALKRVSRVLDVGAYDGYYTLGCAAALRGLGSAAEIIAFEPEQSHVRLLRRSIGMQTDRNENPGSKDSGPPRVDAGSHS